MEYMFAFDNFIVVNITVWTVSGKYANMGESCQHHHLRDMDQFDDYCPEPPKEDKKSCLSNLNSLSESLPILTNGSPEIPVCVERDLSSSDLSILPDSVLCDRLTVLTLDFNNLESLPQSIGNVACNLKVLSLNGNQLTMLPTSIGCLHCLKEMHLIENCLQFLPNSLCQLKKLRILRLTGNNVAKLPDDFGELCSLQNLTIDENKLTNLPKTFGLLGNLNVLEANNNGLQSLPAGFGRLKNLKILNLSLNKIESLPENFGDLECVEFLDLSSNQLEHLPEYFKSSQTLKKLFFDSNMIGVLPDWTSELPQATELSAKDNKLTHQAVSEKFGHTNHKLKVLDLSGNFMTSLPESLGELSELESLHLGSVIDELERRNFQNGNWLSHLPSMFSHIVSLRRLHLDENQIIDLPNDFGLLVNLEFLDLGQNMLHELPDSFSDLRSLKICLLSKNHLQLLPWRFGKLTALEDLRVDNNQIAELPESFENLVQLKTLDLFNNKLTEIPSCINKLTNLVRLDIDENDLGVPRQEVPMIVTQSKYPPRDPALRDNWRGRPRQDLTNLENIFVKVADNMTQEENGQEDDSVKYSEQQLELAARRNMASSIWRSHDGPTVREKFVRGENSFQSWLARNRTFGNVSSDPVTSERVENERDEEDDEEEDEEEDSYTMSYSSKNCDWGSASDEEYQVQSVPVWDEQPVIPTEENWDEEINDPFTSAMDAVPEHQHPTWEEAHQPTKDLDTLFFAFDLHPPALPRNTKSDFNVEQGQFEDADD